MEENRHRAAFTVRVDECGPDGRAGIGTIGNYLQEIAWRHATLLGYGREDLLEKNVAWVMTRMRIQMDGYPLPGEEIRVLTWPSAKDKHLAYRDFRISDANDQMMGRCTTAWAYMDIAERKMVSFHEDGAPMPYSGERSLEFERRSVSRMKDAEHSVGLTSRRSDMDVNGHVNNVHFIEWALESVPDAWLEDFFLREMDISFRQECQAHEQLTSFCAQNGSEMELLHMLKRDADGVEMARISTLWRKK
ncbi:MAG: acyl-[acyl-carrier-protein] thioesterase [Desulfovibrio sp.]